MKIIFAGTPPFAAGALTALLMAGHQVVAVYTQPDRPAGRGQRLTPSAVKEVALAHALPVVQPPSLKGAEEQAALAAWGADVMVVAAYGLLLPAAVLTLPRLGCLNIHASLLPRWRGAAPIQRAILAGDNESGITIMQMDVGLDTGAMLYKVTTPIGSDDNAQRLHERLATLGAAAILHVLDHLEDGSLTAEAQDEAAATYARKLQKSEAAIDWQQPAARIARQIAAFNPFPVAETRLGERVIRIWQAEVAHGSGHPGRVLAADRHGVVVACGEGAIRLLTLQRAGGRPLAVDEFLRGQPLAGVTLGE
jgi:methionyl-tRNA formyltransferase